MKQLLTKRQFRVIEKDLMYEGSFTATFLLKDEIEKRFLTEFTYAISVEVNENVYILKRAVNNPFQYEVYSLK